MPLHYIDVSKKRPFWKELSEDISAEFKINHSASFSNETLFLRSSYKGFDLEFSEADSQPLKVTFSCAAKRNCQVLITGEDFVEKILKFFGANKEIQVGNKEFDDKYLVQGSDDYLLNRLVNTEVQALMLATDVYSLNCNASEKTDVFDFACTVNRRIADFESLKSVHRLICELVNQFLVLRVI